MIAALPAVPAYLTGEPVEDVVKPPPCVAEAVIEQHQKAATAAFTGVRAICVAALTARCFLRCRPFPASPGSLKIAAPKLVGSLMG